MPFVTAEARARMGAAFFELLTALDSVLVEMCTKSDAHVVRSNSRCYDVYAPLLDGIVETWFVLATLLAAMPTRGVWVDSKSYPGVCGNTTVYLLKDRWHCSVVKVVLHTCNAMSYMSTPASHFRGEKRVLFHSHERMIPGLLYKDVNAALYVFIPDPLPEPESDYEPMWSPPEPDCSEPDSELSFSEPDTEPCCSEPDSECEEVVYEC